jgi:hypothetical protein
VFFGHRATHGVQVVPYPQGSFFVQGVRLVGRKFGPVQGAFQVRNEARHGNEDKKSCKMRIEKCKSQNAEGRAYEIPANAPAN